MICLADALFAASNIRSNSIKFSEEGSVDPIINTRAPRIDSSKEGWNSPSLYFEKLTLPTEVPNSLAISSARVLLCEQEKILADVFIWRNKAQI